MVAVIVVVIALADGGTDPVAYSIGAVGSWGLVLVGIAAGFFPRVRPAPLAVACAAALGLLAVFTGLSAIWAANAGAAFDEGIVALAYAGLFVLVVVATANGEARAWLGGLAIGLVGVAVFALGARLEPSIFGRGEEQLVIRLAPSEGRLSEPFLYWNALAAAMATALVLLGWLATSAAGRRARALAVAALPLVVLVLYMTTSRGGLGAAALGLLALVALGPRRLRLAAGLGLGLAAGIVLVLFAGARSELLDHPLTPEAVSQAPGMEAIVIVTVLLTAALAYFADPLLERLRSLQVRLSRNVVYGLVAAAAIALLALVVLADPAERWEEFKQPPVQETDGGERDLLARGGSSGRYQFWSAALDAFESEPLKGVGAAGFETYWSQFGSIPEPAPNGHSLFFDTASELGLPGLVLVFAFAGCALWAGVRRLGARDRDDPDPSATGAAFAVLLAGLAGASIDWIWENPAAFTAVILAAALLAGPATGAPEPRVAVTGERRSRRRFAGGVFVLAFSWIAICASALLLLTNLSISSSRGAFSEGDLAAAEDAAGDAADLEPWAAQPRQQLALVLEAQNRIPEAREAIDEAIERSSEDWRLRLIAARLALRLGDEAQALADVAVAQRLAPRIEVLARPADQVLDGLL